MKEKFKYSKQDKDIVLSGPSDLEIRIDFDDVWHEEVERQTKHLVKLLNKHWNPASEKD